MESNFKVILRDYFGSESSFLKWEEGRPVIPVAVQVSRNRETSEEHLQLRFRNISAKVVEEFAWQAVVTFDDGTTEEVGDRYLDADIAPGGVYGIKPIVLAGVKTSGVEVRILDAESEDGRWDSENCLVSLLPRIELGWGEELLSGRRSLLLQKGVGKERAETRWFARAAVPAWGLGDANAAENTRRSKQFLPMARFRKKIGSGFALAGSPMLVGINAGRVGARKSCFSIPNRRMMFRHLSTIGLSESKLKQPERKRPS